MYQNMFRFLAAFLLVSLTFVIFGGVVLAKTNQNTVVVLPKDEVVDTNYFAAGDTVTLSGTVNGDAYLAGGVVNIEGTVNGDLIAAGGVIYIRGTVTQDVRVAGGQVIITGTIERNLTVVGGAATVADSGRVGGSVVGAGGSVQIYSAIPSDVNIAAGELTIGNTVGGNVFAAVGTLTMSPSANIEGNLTYMSEEPINIQKGATVSGTIREEKRLQMEKEKFKDKAEIAAKAGKSFFYTAKFINIITAFLVGLLFIFLFPKYSATITKQVSEKTWTSMGVGLLTLILAPIVALLLLVTIVGVPIGFLLIVAYFFSIFFAKIFVALVIGSKLINMVSHEKYHHAVVLGLGLLVYLIVSSIPVLGAIVVLLTVITGVGAILLAKIEYYRLLKDKKMI